MVYPAPQEQANSIHDFLKKTGSESFKFSIKYYLLTVISESKNPKLAQLLPL